MGYWFSIYTKIHIMAGGTVWGNPGICYGELELVNKLGKIMKFFMGKYYYHYELPFSKLI